MQVDQSLLRDVERQLNELGSIVNARQFSKEAIAEKIVGIEKGLRKINAITLSQLKAYHQKNVEWQERLTAKSKAFEGKVEDLMAYSSALVKAADE